MKTPNQTISSSAAEEIAALDLDEIDASVAASRKLWSALRLGSALLTTDSDVAALRGGPRELEGPTIRLMPGCELPAATVINSQGWRLNLRYE